MTDDNSSGPTPIPSLQISRPWRCWDCGTILTLLFPSNAVWCSTCDVFYVRNSYVSRVRVLPTEKQAEGIERQLRQQYLLTQKVSRI